MIERNDTGGDWRVGNPAGASRDRIAVRGLQPGDNFCGCADYASNGLGTCKHIEFALHRLQRKRGAADKGLRKLVATQLYPYQAEGALFTARAGRALLADDMGLGKTVQAIAAAELIARHFGVQRLLVVCPTSLKHQWQQELKRFFSAESFIACIESEAVWSGSA